MTNKYLLAPMLLTVSSWACAQAAAGADCAPLPEMKVGSWVITELRGQKRKSTVTEVTDTQIIIKRESLSGNNLDNGTDAITRELNMISGPSPINPSITINFSPNNGIMKFPLCVGDSHQQSVAMQGPKSTTSMTMKSKVTGKEKVTTPAGEFDTYKVEWDSGSQGGTVWYSPKLSRAVKSESKVEHWELLEYGGM